MLALHSDTLLLVALELFQTLHLPQRLGVPVESLKRLIMSVRAAMPDNPYHSWTHVVDVTQTAYALAVISGVLERLSDVERLAFLVSSLLHDVDHPGVDNSFLVSAEAKLAATYGSSPLEHHHMVTAKALVTGEGIDLLRGLSDGQRARFMSVLEGNILATDMAQHKDMRAALRDAVSHGQEDTDLVMRMLITCADISNISKPFPVAMRWAGRIIKEARMQAAREHELNLPSSPLAKIAESPTDMQLGFITGIAMPYFELCSELYPGMGRVAAVARANRDMWNTYSNQRLYAELALVEVEEEHRVMSPSGTPPAPKTM
mmetsp:Transcript_26816/g.66072  ORF Transcript_26816/g.66072 Transcript_26816/m.66072 type:complete len:318 (-) Transcript_26816:401-1354(-)